MYMFYIMYIDTCTPRWSICIRGLGIRREKAKHAHIRASCLGRFSFWQRIQEPCGPRGDEALLLRPAVAPRYVPRCSCSRCFCFIANSKTFARAVEMKLYCLVARSRGNRAKHEDHRA